MDHWIQTYRGRRFPLLESSPSDLDIEDIAHALAHLCRFGGHVREFYSVAQHSVLVSRMVPPADALWGLLHDAAEAYLGDVVSPLKRWSRMNWYRAAETTLLDQIACRWGLEREMPTSVHDADRRACMTEARDLLGPGWESWPGMPAPWDGVIIRPEPPTLARGRFRERFDELTAAGRR